MSGSWPFCALQKTAPGEIFKSKDDTMPGIHIQWKIPGASSLRLQNHKEMHAYIYIYICFFTGISSELFLSPSVMLTSIQAVLFSTVFAGEPFLFCFVFASFYCQCLTRTGTCDIGKNKEVLSFFSSSCSNQLHALCLTQSKLSLLPQQSIFRL